MIGASGDLVKRNTMGDFGESLPGGGFHFGLGVGVLGASVGGGECSGLGSSAGAWSAGSFF